MERRHHDQGRWWPYHAEITQFGTQRQDGSAHPWGPCGLEKHLCSLSLRFPIKKTKILLPVPQGCL